ncbi:hypothetical protein [Escherichia coli]|uniref:hypothetical protein n=1 Tax=Escherichia coli TaxID=562 RepID=UPI002E78B335|nr:hypothetical protein [Escherichia coli]
MTYFPCLIRNKSDFLNPKNRPVALALSGFARKAIGQWRQLKRPFFNQKILAPVPAENGTGLHKIALSSPVLGCDLQKVSDKRLKVG